MTVLQRLAKKGLVVQQRDDRAHKYLPARGRDELIADLMVDALSQADAAGSRAAALVHFVGQVGAQEAAAMREALARLEADSDVTRDRSAPSLDVKPQDR
jgi:predicted transcriptional regulator